MNDIPFVETTISRRIFAIIDVARERGENAAIVGEPGVGKTRALNEYIKRHDGTYFLTVDSLNRASSVGNLRHVGQYRRHSSSCR